MKILKKIVNLDPETFLVAFEKVYYADVAKQENGYWLYSTKERKQRRKDAKNIRRKANKNVIAHSHKAEVLSVKNLKWLTSLVVYASSLVFQKQIRSEKGKLKKQIREVKKRILEVSEFQKRDTHVINTIEAINTIKIPSSLKKKLRGINYFKKVFEKNLKALEKEMSLINKWQKPFNTEICDLLLSYVDERKSWLALYDYASRHPQELESVYSKLKKSNLLRTKRSLIHSQKWLVLLL